MCRYAYSFGAISAGVVFIWGIPALFFYLMWHARNVNVAKQWYVGVCWGVGCTQVTFEIQLWNTKSEIWVDVAADPPRQRQLLLKCRRRSTSNAFVVCFDG